jgi:hypothetical protein
MKNKWIIVVAILGFAVLVCPSAQAAKGEGPKARFFAKYDLNKNGVIDGKEKDAVRKDYAADKEGDLKRFDTNKDGQLDDEELAAIKPPTGKKKSEARAKKSAPGYAGEKPGDAAGKDAPTDKPAEKSPAESSSKPAAPK